jgi:hypothetical protein
MASQPVRVPDSVYEELQNAARLIGCTPGELFERAWSSYRESPEFTEDFTAFQQAFAKGDINAVTERLRSASSERASRRAAASRKARGR